MIRKFDRNKVFSVVCICQVQTSEVHSTDGGLLMTTLATTEREWEPRLVCHHCGRKFATGDSLGTHLYGVDSSGESHCKGKP